MHFYRLGVERVPFQEPERADKNSLKIATFEKLFRSHASVWIPSDERVENLLRLCWQLAPLRREERQGGLDVGAGGREGVVVRKRWASAKVDRVQDAPERVEIVCRRGRRLVEDVLGGCIHVRRSA